ncbi:hypothetical protein [Phenylobacterium sp.]|uniref:hypothetical protein n=1 Tax=Phenylobacterium sp. TaxID=1871053 RepID=UPI002612D9B1|nr:hypothetical protein [Phenylobacterium sp.]
MDFLKILRSFEDFVFEAVSWLIFYPLTLWRIVRHPLRTMDYSDAEQSQEGEARYDDAISPPLVLLATLVLANIPGRPDGLVSPEAGDRLGRGGLSGDPGPGPGQPDHDRHLHPHRLHLKPGGDPSEPPPITAQKVSPTISSLLAQRAAAWAGSTA